MVFNPDRHHRRSIRLKDYNYSQEGAYFVTICTHERECLFGEIRDGEMFLSDAGRRVRPIWDQLSDHYPHNRLDAFVIMPNHVHGIVILNDCADVGAGLKPALTDKMRHGLPEIIRAFKTFSSRRINEFRKMIGVPLWQRNYYEHVIRNEKSLIAVREYIQANPYQWPNDPDNLDCSRQEGPSNDR